LGWSKAYEEWKVCHLAIYQLDSTGGFAGPIRRNQPALRRFADPVLRALGDAALVPDGRDLSRLAMVGWISRGFMVGFSLWLMKIRGVLPK